MFAERDKHYPSRSGQTSLAAAIAKFTKPVAKNYFGPSTAATKSKISYFSYWLTCQAAILQPVIEGEMAKLRWRAHLQLQKQRCRYARIIFHEGHDKSCLVPLQFVCF